MDAIVRARQEDAIGYVRVIAALLPKYINLKVQQLDDLTDDQLERLERVARTCPVRRSIEAGIDFVETITRTGPSSPVRVGVAHAA